MLDTAVITPPQVTAELVIEEISRAQAERIACPAARWDAGMLTDYITEEIERASGPQLPCRNSQEMLQGFWERHGAEKAVRIARAAFEIYGGKWAGAPVTVRRFSASNDIFFAEPILAQLGA